MTPEQRARMNELCQQMQAEQDSERLAALAEQLNQLLGEAEASRDGNRPKARPRV